MKASPGSCGPKTKGIHVAASYGHISRVEYTTCMSSKQWHSRQRDRRWKHNVDLVFSSLSLIKSPCQMKEAYISLRGKKCRKGRDVRDLTGLIFVFSILFHYFSLQLKS